MSPYWTYLKLQIISNITKTRLYHSNKQISAMQQKRDKIL